MERDNGGTMDNEVIVEKKRNIIIAHLILKYLIFEKRLKNNFLCKLISTNIPIYVLAYNSMIKFLSI